MKYRTLGTTGMKVSILSYGASSLGSVFHETSESEGIAATHCALERGINFLDVSPYYGATKAEAVLGKALKGVDRKSYYLATKVGQYNQEEFDFSAERVTRSLDESCERLGVDYIDLLQCHDIEFAEQSQILTETLPALHELKAAGRIGHVGITGLPLKVLKDVVQKAEPGMVETVLSFCHYELNDDSLAQLVPLFAAQQVGIINASPTGMGILTERGAPHWHPASPAMTAGCRKAVEYCQEKGYDIVELAMQFAVANPDIATTLFSSANPENVKNNIDVVEREIDPVRLQEVLEILKPIHNWNFTRGLAANRDVLIGE